MAKSTPARKRKATDDIDVSSEEDDSSSSSSSDSEMSEGNSDDENNDNMDEDSDNDDEEVEPTTTKTPANKQTTSKKNKTPNSSGMKMRSGRKKKRKKSISPKNSSTRAGAPSTTKKKRGTTTNPRKRAKKSTAADDDNDDDEDSVLANGGKRNGKKTASKLVNDNDSSEKEEETTHTKKKKGNRRKSVGFDATTKKGSGSSRRAAIDENATIKKVPHAHEQTREAVAAAQMSQSPTISEESAAAANNSSGSSNGGGGILGGGLLHLVSQTLRLPSQHTPAKPTSQQQEDSDDNLDSDAAESPAPPLAGGRRLIFATTAKKKAGGGGRAGGRNKLLMQTRDKQQQQAEKTSSKKQTSTTTSDSTPESNDDNDNQEESSSLLVQLTNEWEENGEEYKKDIVLYTKGWFFVLFLCFVVGNIANMSLFNVRSQSIKLSKLYGIESKFTGTISETPDDNNGEGGATATPPEIVTITQPDPDLKVANARATYRAERMNTHDISKIDKSMEEMSKMMKVVDDTMTSWMKDYPNVAFGETKDDDERQNKDESVIKISASIIEKQNVLLEWEWALVALEEAMDAFTNGDIGPEEVNKAMDELTKVSMLKSEAALLDMSKISVPGEGCEGMDYNNIPTKQVKSDSQVGKEDTVEVVGGIDVDALNIASDSPILIEDAKNVYQSLVTLAQSTSEALIGPSGASNHAKQWLEQVIGKELHKRGVDENLPSIDETTIPSSSFGKPAPSNTDGVYTFNDAVTDIDRLLEIEDADRTGKFDYASIVNGAQVVRRGPYATSYSLYETLPLVNRVLAYTKLRFYGHPPEAALVPTFPMHTRGQCWSFTNEQSSSRTSRQAGGGIDDMIGDYATLTISLPSAISVSEVMVEHIPPTITSDPTSSAMKEFRVLGFEDTGAFGEPWELGSFVFNNVGPSIQRFAIPTTLDGQNVPKLNSIAIAVDTNWGGDYTCLYRVRVHQ